MLGRHTVIVIEKHFTFAISKNANMKKLYVALFKLLFIITLFVIINNASAQSYQQIHDKAIVIDGHNDILSHNADSGYSFDQNLSGKTNIDMRRMSQGGIDVQVFSVWCNGQKKQPFAYANLQIDTLYSWIGRNPSKIKLIHTPDELMQSVKQKKLGAMLGVEGGHMIENNLKNLDSLYKRGVRYMGLTWENSTSWATSANDESKNQIPNQNKGLNDFGKQIVRQMNELGMMVDISHAGEQTFWDVINTTTKPIIASHSCVYNLCPHHRNLKDEQIKAIGKNDGIIMVCFYPGFLDSTWIKKERAFDKQHKAEEDSIRKVNPDEDFMDTYLYSKYRKELEAIDREVPLSLLIDHIDYIVKMIGVDHVGLGSDFDGMSDPTQGLDGNGVLDFPKITKALLAGGYSQKDVNKILGENFIRVFKANMQ
jgi:membrane dipeptidase